jgi:hypothetical protein
VHKKGYMVGQNIGCCSLLLPGGPFWQRFGVEQKMTEKQKVMKGHWG